MTPRGAVHSLLLQEINQRYHLLPHLKGVYLPVIILTLAQHYLVVCLCVHNQSLFKAPLIPNTLPQPAYSVMMVRIFTTFCPLVLPVAYAVPQGRTCPQDCVNALYNCGIGLGERKGVPVSKPFAVLNMVQVLTHDMALITVNTGIVKLA